MSMPANGPTLYEPTELDIKNSELTKYKKWLSINYQLHFNSHQELWEWSTSDISTFWKSVWEYGEVLHSQTFEEIVSNDVMPYVQWFKSAKLNYAEQILKHQHLEQPALIFKSEHKSIKEMSWGDLAEKVTALAQTFKELGLQKGDRVAAFMPNIPETVIAFIACASIGAIWSSTSPDFGAGSVVDRFQQIEPKILIAVDGYQYNGVPFNKKEVIQQLKNEIPSIEKVILVNYIESIEKGEISDSISWEAAITRREGAKLTFEQVDFSHPLWILYSSGTTGIPKPIVHSHGGMVIEQIKSIRIEGNITKNDRVFWFTTTGWMMWNTLIGGLMNGSTVTLYDGSPSYPNLAVLWEYAEEVGCTVFGTSAAFIDACMKFDFKPNNYFKFNKLKSILATASPLTASAFDWTYQHVKKDLVLISISGGTDVCTGFVGGNNLLPVRAGVIPTRALGTKVESFNEEGIAVYNEVGELVVTKPMPSMPIYFWGDTDFTRYKESYFEHFPNVWTHGDWIQINDDGSCVIYGRSDSTINRAGIRMGTSEIYKIIEAIPEILESLVIDLEYKDRSSHMPLFIVLKDGHELSEQLIQNIKESIKAGLSPRFIPDEIIAVQQIPKTLNGKKLEVPIRKILLGQPVEKSINRDAMLNPSALDYYIEYSKLINVN
jgi:acetoacetyl-CoA synthetase